MWTVQVVRTQSIEIWGIWYINESFLVWIIPLRYQSHESIYWACITCFVTSIYPIIWCLIPALVCLCLQHSFQCMLFWFEFIDTRVLIPARHLAFIIWLIGEFWLPWILMSKSWSLRLVDSPDCWSEWRSGSVVDQWKTVWGPILPGHLTQL